MDGAVTIALPQYIGLPTIGRLINTEYSVVHVFALVYTVFFWAFIPNQWDVRFQTISTKDAAIHKKIIAFLWTKF